jgi:hypothetical protein
MSCLETVIKRLTLLAPSVNGDKLQDQGSSPNMGKDLALLPHTRAYSWTHRVSYKASFPVITFIDEWRWPPTYT